MRYMNHKEETLQLPSNANCQVTASRDHVPGSILCELTPWAGWTSLRHELVEPEATDSLTMMQVQNLFARMEVTSDRQTLFRFLSHADQHVMYPHVTLQTLCRHPAVLDAGHTRQGYIMENPCPSIVTLLLEKQHRLFAGRADPESSHHQSLAQKKRSSSGC